MENFVVSARKYRPATFDTVVGQNAITSTLKNAIKTNHLAQAYLFCGPRGVGKTTCARIFAKTINCENLSQTIEACGKCGPCLSFSESNSFNVFELDAASNNSVDDIRTLVDQVRIPPQIGQYKIYIIDEVHMLSQAAFNAFLKTLEEPPAYAKFILATTEKHKIIPTILSRCQVFDFNRITIDDIAKHLAYVAKNEKVKAETDALHIIAQKADGALRDALSMFDQLVSFSGDDGITYQSVLQNLNVLDYDYYFKAVESLLSNNTSSILMLANEVIENGFDGHHFITGLGEHLRNLLVSRDTITLKLIETSDNIREKYKEQAQLCSLPFLMKALELGSKCDLNYKIATNKRLLLELTLLQMCNSPVETGSYIAAVEMPKPSVAVDFSNKTEKPIAPQQEKITPAVPVTVEKTEPLAHKVEDPSPEVRTSIKPNVVAKTLSIKEQLNEANNAQLMSESNAGYGTSEDEFDSEKLNEAWTKFYEQIVKTKPESASVIKVRFPEIKENWALDLLVDNPIADSDLLETKTDLMEFLRKELNNNKISLTTHMEVSKVEAKPFTATEKFNKMASDNPDLQKFKDKFDLELDF